MVLADKLILGSGYLWVFVGLFWNFDFSEMWIRNGRR